MPVKKYLKWCYFIATRFDRLNLSRAVSIYKIASPWKTYKSNFSYKHLHLIIYSQDSTRQYRIAASTSVNIRTNDDVGDRECVSISKFVSLKAFLQHSPLPPSPFTKFLLTSFVNSASNDLSTSYTSRDKIRSCSSVARSSVAKTIYCIENIERGRCIRSENFSIFAYSFRWSIVIVFSYWTYDIPRTLHLSWT